MLYFVYFVLAFVIAAFLTFPIAAGAYKLGLVDRPKAEARKIHKKKTPYGGGLVLYISFFAALAIAIWGKAIPAGSRPDVSTVLGLALGGLVLMALGFMDDKHNLPARRQMLGPVAAAVLFVVFGSAPSVITNPLGGIVNLSLFSLSLGVFGDWLILADVLVFAWLLGMMYTTKFLDGLDGLVAGIAAIGAVMLVYLSLQTRWYQPDVALLASIFAGVCLGFLLWNFHPAKVFLGEGGSLFAGFMLGALAVMSQGKIATTVLVLAVPIVDAARVILVRLRSGRPVHIGDSEHLHFRLLKSGFGHRQAVLALYAISLLFGASMLFLQSGRRQIALAALLALMILLGVWYSHREKKQKSAAA